MTRKQPAQAGEHRTQAERFIETARALGADEDQAAFKAKLAVIARQKGAPPSTLAKAKKGS